MATLKANLQYLEFLTKKTEALLVEGNQEALNRQLRALKAQEEKCQNDRVLVEAKMFQEEKAPEEIAKWSEIIEKQLKIADQNMTKIVAWFNEIKATKAENERQQKEEREEREAQKKLEEIQRQQEEILQFEMKIQQLKLETAEKLRQPTAVQGDQPQVHVQTSKLPKMEIKQFNGNKIDWPRFWSQFVENVEKKPIAATEKLSYLHAYLTPKPLATITGLPFTEEGYEQAKTVLQNKFGCEEMIITAFVQEVTGLPRITSTNVKKIEEFYTKLDIAVRSLKTMGKEHYVAGHVIITLDKLPSIKSELTLTDPKWMRWGFEELLEHLDQWIKRNTVVQAENEDDHANRKEVKLRKSFQTKEFKPRACTYCGNANHKMSDCDKVSDVKERRAILIKKRLCFNCASGEHRASNCPSKRTCVRCDGKHHTSICETESQTALATQNALKTQLTKEGNFPVVTVKVKGITTRALVDSGSGTSYMSAHLAGMLKQRPIRSDEATISMMLTTSRVRLSVYEAEITALDDSYSTIVQLTRVDKPGPLLMIDNPQYDRLISTYEHLKGVHMLDNDERVRLPVHVVLGKDVYTKIKTATKPRLGGESEPIAELTKFGWYVMSPGYEFNQRSVMVAQTYHDDYDKLCRLDVLGLADGPEHSQTIVHQEFKEQLTRQPEGWYETGLPWKGNHPQLPTNEEGSKRRLNSLLVRLKRSNLVEPYDEIIRNQLAEGVIEHAPAVANGREFYIPHKAVVREAAASTKLRVVYDASARVAPNVPSLNDCLYPGPPLQNRLWDVLVKQRSYPIVVTGDIAKAFLQVRIREEERDALRFHWRVHNDQPVETYRFTRALFGLTSSPFLLGGVIEAHLDTWEDKYSEEIDLLRRSLYVDDLLTGGSSLNEAEQRKEFAKMVMADATFTLHKWNSNESSLETPQLEGDTDPSYAKEQLGTGPSDCKLLGVRWNKRADTISVELPTQPSPPTKRGVLSQLAKIYDPLGLVSPLSLQGKMLYRQACEIKTGWDNELPPAVLGAWRKWESSVPAAVTFPRPITAYQEPIEKVQLHAFGDASANGVGAAVYSVTTQKSGVTARLVAAKARLAKQGLTIPRLELIAAHMATNLVTNVKNALQDLPVTEIYGWSDSTVVLHWLRGGGEYRQFVTNRVQKIHEHPEIQWQHVPTEENPADLASRGGQVNDLWRNGPEWLANKVDWPENPTVRSSPESEAEGKTIIRVMRTALQTPTDDLDLMLARHRLRKVLRIQAYMRRWVTKAKGPLTAEETSYELNWWIKREQLRDQLRVDHENTSNQLNLQINSEGLLECRGRIQGRYPIYLPFRSRLTRAIVERQHLQNLHGGVGSTMAAVREKYWVPRLRSLAKAVRKDCIGCRRFQAVPMTKPIPGNLPIDRTTPAGAFEVVGVDYAGPVKYRKGKKEGKAYILLWACSLSRAVHLEVLPDLTADTFIRAFKRFVARRGRPKAIYSDNGGAFVAANKWLRKLRKEEEVMGLLEDYDIAWKFNLSRAPWWGGQFERLIGVIKQAFYKEVGGRQLTWDELTEAILDVEIQVNRRPLTYVEDDIESSPLTPQKFLYPRTNHLLEQPVHQGTDKSMRRRLRILQNCKDQLWRRWVREYLTALRERHNLTHKVTKYLPKEGDVVIIRAESKNRGTWSLGVITHLFPDKAGNVRAVRLKTANGEIERAPQLLYPLELQCEVAESQLNPEAAPYEPRPRRKAAETANSFIQEIANFENLM